MYVRRTYFFIFVFVLLLQFVIRIITGHSTTFDTIAYNISPSSQYFTYDIIFNRDK